MTGKDIPLAGVIGDPIAHSKSPRLHGHWLARYGIAGHYVPLHVRAENLAGVLRAMPDMGFVGANVTIPHKQAALALASSVSDAARRIGAANTLTFDASGGFHADNTDGAGFIANLQQNAPNWQAAHSPALLIGAGGATRAIVVALLDAGAPEILITNRTAQRAVELADVFGARVRVFDWDDTPNMLAHAGLVVNTTALGMDGADEFPFSLNALRADTLVTDIVYTPLETPFLLAAQAQGCQIVDGLGMLLHQAAPGFARWFRTAPQVDADARRAVLA
jgi:shikimate dehydrogenase